MKHILAIPMPGAIEWIADSSSTGIHGVVFDHGPSGGPFLPLASLVPIRDWIAARPAGA